MYRKRGAPVFLELMGDRARSIPVRPPQAPRERPAPLFEGASSAVEPKPATLPALASAEEVEARGSGLLGGRLLGDGRGGRVWWYVGAGAALAVVVWVIAYTAGKQSVFEEAERRKYEITSRYAAEETGVVGSAAGPVDPLNAPGRGTGMADAGAKPQPPSGGAASGVGGSPSASGAPGSLPLVDGGIQRLEKGYNYLLVATLMKRDAEEVAAYLGSKGLRTAFVSTGGRAIDPGGSDANNGPWMVLVLRGYASSEFRARESERSALVTQVHSLGRAWKAANRRAPDDFSQAYWWKYR